MLVNQRIRKIRQYRRLEGRELARMAGLSAAEISHVENKMRTPKIDTLQKISAALDVTTGFLLGEEDADISLPRALPIQSLRVFLRRNKVTPDVEAYLHRISTRNSAPDSVKGWKDLLANVGQLPGQEIFSDLKLS
jgi:transcriptional regulator with XRE-family HTH domain